MALPRSQDGGASRILLREQKLLQGSRHPNPNRYPNPSPNWKDEFLQGKAREHPEKYIDLDILLTFARMKPYDTYKEELAEVLQDSKVVEISSDGQMLRRRPGQ